MEFDWNLIIAAIGLFLGLQLIILSALMIKEQKYFLAALGFLFFGWCARNTFIEPDLENFFYVFFFSSGHELFVPPTIYLIIYVTCKRHFFLAQLFHYLPPLLIHSTYAFIRFNLTHEHYIEIRNHFIFTATIGYLILTTIVYALFSYRLLTASRGTLIDRAYRKYLFLLWLIVPHFVFSSIVSIVGMSHHLNITFLVKFQDGPFMVAMYSISYAIYFVQGTFVALLMLSELSSFKKFQLPKNVHIKSDTELNEDLNFRQKIINLGLHKRIELTVNIVCKELQVNKGQLVNYLKKEEKASFNKFINDLRIDEFKLLLKQKDNEKYDLVSIAKMAGFNSKATFNRVFKDREGQTPSDYKKSLESD